MKKQACLIAIVLMLMTTGYAGMAFGAVSPDEASKLGGPVLTPIGAERAGNKEGTIPEWTGTPIPIPKEYKKGSGLYVDPFANEKPLFSINAKNMNQYADKLTEGVRALMKKYPDYRIDVYKTHRTLVFPKWYYDMTKKNATTCEVVKDSEAVTGKGCHGGTPFPIPKNGNELLWNHQLKFEAPEAMTMDYENYNITATGKISISAWGFWHNNFLWNSPEHENDWRHMIWRSEYLGPARRAGEGLLMIFPLDYKDKGLVAWQYLPGQRRVRLAPDICCDTPNVNTAGASVYDDSEVFMGSPDRFHWKLVGKKEIYVPYNAYKWVYYRGDVNKALLPHHENPDLVRWELHRVWVLEGTLRPNKRHVYSKRLFYLDEDSFGAILADNYDKRGNLYRVIISPSTYSYDVQCQYKDIATFYDLIASSYAIQLWPRGGVKYMKFFPESLFSPESLAGSGLR